MDNLKIVGAPLPNMPWEDRPEGSKEVLWRYSKNPLFRNIHLFKKEERYDDEK